jgi:hypothetical protein
MCTSRTPVFTRLKTIKNCITHDLQPGHTGSFLTPSISPTPQYSPQYAKSKILFPTNLRRSLNKSYPQDHCKTFSTTLRGWSFEETQSFHFGFACKWSQRV